MSTLSIRDQRLAGATMLPDDFIDYYMPRANGDFVKIYLYLLRSVHAQTPAPTISSLADVFRLTERDVDRALRYWQEAGLLDLKYKAEELDEITLLPVSQKLHETRKDPVLETPAAAVSEPAAETQVSTARMKELKADEKTRDKSGTFSMWHTGISAIRSVRPICGACSIYTTTCICRQN